MRSEAVLKAVRSVESLASYSFNDPATLIEALTHSSYYNELSAVSDAVVASDNERLEFLGDAVIGLVVARGLMERFRTASEGLLSKLRSQLVSRKTLAEIAHRLGLGAHVLLGRGELATGGSQKRSILSAAFEAVVAALYLDGGMEAATQFLERVYQPLFSELQSLTSELGGLADSKTLLQERSQAFYRITPCY